MSDLVSDLWWISDLVSDLWWISDLVSEWCISDLVSGEISDAVSDELVMWWMICDKSDMDEWYVMSRSGSNTTISIHVSLAMWDREKVVYWVV